MDACQRAMEHLTASGILTYKARRGDRQVPCAVCGRPRRRIRARYVRRGGNRLSDGDALLLCAARGRRPAPSWRRSGGSCAG